MKLSFLEHPKRDNEVNRLIELKINAYLGGLDNLIGEAFWHGFETTEGRLLRVLNDVVNSLVHSTKRGYINSLSTNNTTRSDTSGIFTWTTVANSIKSNLDWVLSCEEVDQFHGLFNCSDSHLLLTVVTSSRCHQHNSKTLNDWTLNLLKSSLLVAASSVRNINLLLCSFHL